MRKTFVALATLGALFVVSSPQPSRGQDPHSDLAKRIADLEQRVAKLERLLFVESLITWEAHSEIFPERWTTEPFNIKAKPIHNLQRTRAVAAVSRAIEKYPDTLIRNTLQRVYVVGELTLYNNQHFAGTASNTAVYLVVQSEKAGYTDRFVESTFHREYSTLLLNLYLKHLDQSAWNQINPRVFRYAGANSWDHPQGQDGGAKSIDEGKASLSLAPSEDLKYGFLTEYSKSSLENDFNEYAAALFLNEPRFGKLTEEHPAVANKRDLAVRFYSLLDPKLTPAYFKKLRTEK